METYSQFCGWMQECLFQSCQNCNLLLTNHGKDSSELLSDLRWGPLYVFTYIQLSYFC